MTTATTVFPNRAGDRAARPRLERVESAVVSFAEHLSAWAVRHAERREQRLAVSAVAERVDTAARLERERGWLADARLGQPMR